MLGMFTLIALGFLVLIINPAIPHGAFALGTSGQPILDGFPAIFGVDWAKALALFAVAGLIASFHAIIFAYGRQIYSLSRAGYFPHFLSVTHGEHKTPNIALVAGGLVGFAVMLVVWFAMGGEAAGSFIGGVLLNMAVFGAMFSYLLQGLTFLQLGAAFRTSSGPIGARSASLEHRLRSSLPCDDLLPARRSALSPRRDRGRHLVRACDHLLRRLRAKDARLFARGGVRREASRENWCELTKWKKRSLERTSGSFKARTFKSGKAFMVWLLGRLIMARHTVIDRSGHTKFEFDGTHTTDIAEAERRFKKLVAKGFIPAESKGGGKHHVPEQSKRPFDPHSEETIFIPALKGG